MPKFRKRPVVIDADQWFKNGDHPEDGCRLLSPDPDSARQFEPHYVGEGKIVRRYRDPDNDGHHVCGFCGTQKSMHGWIDTSEGGHIVCPGDWIIKDERVKEGQHGRFYPCKPAVFVETYDPVEATDS